MVPNPPPAFITKHFRIPGALYFLYIFVKSAAGPFVENSLHTSVSAAAVLQWAKIYFCAALAFCTLLFLIGNVKGLLWRTPRRLSLSNDYVDGNPPKVPEVEAFRYDTPMSPYEWVKVAFFGFTGILFVRLFACILFLFAGLLTVNIGALLDRYKYPWWFGLWSRLGIICGILVFTSVGVHHIKVFGHVARRDECKLLVFNHSCVMEVLLSFFLGDFPSFVSRRENTKVLLFGGVVKACDGILVDRDAATSRHQTLEAIKERALNPQGPQVVIFPEGTTGNQESLFMFKKGAFEAGEPVQMVCVAFPYKHFNPAWTGPSVGGNDVRTILLRLCSQFETPAEVRCLPVYHPTAEEKSDPISYADHCQKMMATVLHENISDATFADYGRAAEHYQAALKKKKVT